MRTTKPLKPGQKGTKEVELLLEKRLREVERTARSEADRARNQAIGALSFFALVLSIIGFFGGSALVKSWAREASGSRIEEILPEYKAKLANAVEDANASRGQAVNDANATKKALGEVSRIRSQITSGEFPGDIAANQNSWGKCQWVDFTEEQVGLALERIGLENTPGYGCPTVPS